MRPCLPDLKTYVSEFFSHILLTRQLSAVCGAALLLPLVLTVGCEQANHSNHVQLVPGSASPSPSMRFELRFDDVMVSPAQLGVAPVSPLLIAPSLPGSFTWISPCSGIFTPTEALALDTRYRLTLRPGLTRADGQRSPAGLRWTIQTPPLTVIGSAFSRSAGDYASGTAEITLAFNAAVPADDAHRFAFFRDASGRRIGAELRHATQADIEELWPRESWRTWQEEFRLSRDANETSRTGSSTFQHLLRISPATALPPGTNWNLVLLPGFPATIRRLHLREKLEVRIGDVHPFALLEVKARHRIYEGPSICLRFSKRLDEAAAETLGEWLQVTPTPKGLHGEVSGQELTLHGEFRSGSVYALRLSRHIPAEEPYNLSGSNAFEVTIPEIPARIYFPAFSHDQLANGQRSFPLMCVNVPQIKLRAKLIEPGTAVHALRGFDRYFQHRNQDDPDEPYRELDYNLIPGRTLFSQLITGAPAPNVAQTTNLDWDQLLGGRRNGLVFLDARAEKPNITSQPGAQAIIQLSDLGLVWKQAPEGILVFAFSCDSGAAAEGVEVILRTEENESLAQATTDHDGLARLAGHPQARWLSLQKEGDSHVIDLDSRPGWVREDDPRRVLLFSDRALYRPGEIVHLKGLVRQWREATLEIPRNQSGQLTLFDPRGQSCFETAIVFSRAGSFTTDLPLPNRRRGQHLIRLRWNDQEYHHPIEVQDFEPDAFEIKVDGQSVYAAEEPLEIPVSARYWGGEPLSRAQVKWYLSAHPNSFSADAFADYSFGKRAPERGWREQSSGLALNGDALLLNSTNLVLMPELPFNAVAPSPLTASLLVELTDLNQQTLSRRLQFVRHSSAFYVGLKTAAAGGSTNNTTALEAVAVRADGQPWTNAVDACLRVQRMEWQNLRVQGAGRTVRYQSHLLLSNVCEQRVSLSPQLQSVEAANLSNLAARWGQHVLPGLAAGRYLAELSAQDAAGRPVVSSLEFTVSEADRLSSSYANELALKMIPDRKAYAPGQSAKLLIEAPFSGLALITVEREKVLRSFVTRLEGATPTITVPILNEDVPNVYVSATLLRGAKDSSAQFKLPNQRIGSCELTVIDDQNRLQLTLIPKTDQYRPGQTIELNVQADNANGLPAADAEVTLYAIDEGVLSLQDYAAPDPLGFFYAARNHSVQTGTSLSRLLPEDPEEFAFANKGFLGGGGGKGGQCAVRQNFLSCCYWNATLITDAAGKVTARFNAPDNMASYRVFAIAHQGACFGSGQTSFKVSKPLVVQPALPAFASVSDHLQARALIQNRTDHEGQVTVRLDLDSTARPDGGAPLAQTILVPAGAARIVEFPLTLLEPGTSRWIWTAQWAEPPNPDLNDAIQSQLEVRHPLPLLREVLLRRITTGASDLLESANPQLLAGQGTIQVTLANTRLGELSETAAQLLHYPYGCAEQTSSSLLPWLVLRDKTDVLPGLQREKPKAEQAITAGIQRLFSMQTASGGLGYWPGASEPMFWASAYGGLVLALAERHGGPVPKNDFANLLGFLSQQLRSADSRPSALPDACLALYALAVAGRAEPAYHEKLYSLRQKLGVEARAWLALAIAESKGPPEMIDRLLAPEDPAPPQGEAAFSSDARAAALRLLSRIAQRSELSLLDAAVNHLMDLQHNGHWNSTQADAWALLALTEYARQVEQNVQPAEGHLSWNNQRIPFQLDAGKQTFTVTVSNNARVDSKLTLVKPLGTSLFSTVVLSARPPGISQPQLDRGFSVERRYVRLDDFNEPRDLQGLRVGDRVMVTLRVAVPRDSAYVVIDDPLPSILEPINSAFQSRAGRFPPLQASGDRMWRSDFQELRADRYLSFADGLPAGKYTLRYLARVRAAGKVTAGSTKVEEMYHPERYGIAETQVLTSQSAN
jgi:uncharacterized protein YfaS (alpha-2-macroglobulin family)